MNGDEASAFFGLLHIQICIGCFGANEPGERAHYDTPQASVFAEMSGGFGVTLRIFAGVLFVKIDAPFLRHREGICTQYAIMAGNHVRLGYAKTGGTLVVLLLAVLFLRKGLRSRTDEIDEIDRATLARSAQPFGVLSATEVAKVPGPAVLAPRPVAVGAGGLGGESRDDNDRRALDPAAEVLDLIDREPEDVAALLRSWVADRRS